MSAKGCPGEDLPRSGNTLPSNALGVPAQRGTSLSRGRDTPSDVERGARKCMAYKQWHPPCTLARPEVDRTTTEGGKRWDLAA